MEGATLARKPLAGRVTSEGFSVRLRGGFGSAIMPAARGRFGSDPAGTFIVVRIGMRLKGWVAVGGWTMFSVGFGSLQVARELSNPIAPTVERAARAMEAMVPPAVMLGFLGVGVLHSAWVHRGDADQLLVALKNALDASPGPDFRPLA
jgi:hypothetical protein